MTFVFTKTPPSEVGHYWIRFGKHIWIDEVKYGEYFPIESIIAYQKLKTKKARLAFKQPVGFYVPGGASYEDYSVEEKDYEWAGPIPRPEESL